MLAVRKRLPAPVGTLVPLQPRPIVYLLVPERALRVPGVLQRITLGSHRRRLLYGSQRWVVVHLRPRLLKFILRLQARVYLDLRHRQLRINLLACLVLGPSDVLNALRCGMQLVKPAARKYSGLNPRGAALCRNLPRPWP